MTFPIGILAQGAGTNYGYWYSTPPAGVFFGYAEADSSGNTHTLALSPYTYRKFNNIGQMTHKFTAASTGVSAQYSINPTGDVFLQYPVGSGQYSIFKLNSSSTFQWGRNFILGSSIALGPIQGHTDGGLVATGSYDGAGSWSNLFVRKHSSTGSVSWSKSYANPLGANFIFSTHVRQVPNGTDIYAYGTMSGSTSEPSRIFILKFNSAGTLQFSRTLTPSSSLDNYNSIQVYGADLDSSGNSYIHFANETSQRIAKLDSNGAVVWAKSFGTLAYSADSLSVGLDGNIYLDMGSRIHTKIDASTGGIIWSMQLSSGGSLDQLFNRVSGEYLAVNSASIFKGDSNTPKSAVFGSVNYAPDTTISLSNVTHSTVSVTLTATTLTTTESTFTNPLSSATPETMTILTA